MNYNRTFQFNFFAGHVYNEFFFFNAGALNPWWFFHFSSFKEKHFRETLLIAQHW